MTEDTKALTRILESITTPFLPMADIEDDVSWQDQFGALLNDLGVDEHALAIVVDGAYNGSNAECGAFIVGFVAGIQYERQAA